MKWKTPSGKFKDVPMHKYLIDWDDDQDSEQSSQLADFLYPYWRHDVVCCQVPCVGTRMSYDYVNVSKKVICEFDGNQHQNFIEGFFHKSREDYKAQIKRDILKDKLAEASGFKMVRIRPEDLSKLSPQWFKETWEVIL
jgi:hypothetical protein